MRLILLRHAQSPSNIEMLLDTLVPGPALTELGEQQASAVPGLLADEPIEAVYASTQTRAQQTARPLATARGLPVHVRDGLREISAGDLEMRGDDEAKHAYVSMFMAWATGDLAASVPGGEHGPDALDRFDQVVSEAAAAHGAAVLVSHGAVIRLWTMNNAANLSADFVRSHPLSNTGRVILEGDPEAGWVVLSWDGVTLDEALVT